MPFNTLLSRIVQSLPLELEWIDLFSQLEYVGCRKIVKSRPFEEISSKVLQHIAEEASHAFLMKRLAETLGLPERPWTHGLFVALGWNYFRTLDERICALPGAEANTFYPGVSWAVEQRVLRIYPAYIEATTRPEVKRVLLRILAQERRHGSEFELHDFPEGLRAEMLRIESELWDEFLSAGLAAIDVFEAKQREESDLRKSTFDEIHIHSHSAIL